MKAILIVLINSVFILLSSNYFNIKEMVQGDYLYVKSHRIKYDSENERSLEIVLNDKLSKKFISEYLENQNLIKNYLVSPNSIEAVDSIKIKSHLTNYFSIEIKNYCKENYGISDDMGLPIIQEAKDANGNWKPIEYITLNGSILYQRIDLPANYGIEIAAPRYSGEYETDLRLKVAIMGYGILTSESYKGKINYSQFKIPKSKSLKDRIHFLN